MQFVCYKFRMKSFSQKSLYLLVIVLVACLVVAGYLYYKQRTDLKNTQQNLDEVVAEMEFERQQSVEEYERLAREYEDYYINTDNDSLLKLIDAEKQRVQQLLQELKTVKATNAHRISELKRELSTVRGVLQNYVQKVDSLNNINKSLKTENRQVKEKYEQTAKQLELITAEAEELDKRITLASMLEADNFHVETLNQKGKQTQRIAKITKLEICFSLLRNITAEPGLKTVYLRLTNSQEELLGMPGQNLFSFEDNTLEYSVKKEVEYGGETTTVCVYYPVQQRLTAGVYTATVFVDGNIIGSYRFTIN